MGAEWWRCVADRWILPLAAVDVFEDPLRSGRSCLGGGSALTENAGLERTLVCEREPLC